MENQTPRRTSNPRRRTENQNQNPQPRTENQTNREPRTENREPLSVRPEAISRTDGYASENGGYSSTRRRTYASTRISHRNAPTPKSYRPCGYSVVMRIMIHETNDVTHHANSTKKRS